MNLLLSAHADDIAYSLGGALLQGYIDPSTATLVTVFQRSLYAPYVLPGAMVEEASAIRYAEDLTYAAQIGLKHQGLGLEDATLRGYPDLDCIFTVANYGQDPGAAASINTIQSFLDQQTAIERLWVPLSIGNHIDHVLLFQAVLGWQAPTALEIIFYEDIPYAGFEELANIAPWVQQVIGPAQPEIIDISVHFAKKLQNLAVYDSQVSTADIELVKLHAQRIVPGLAVERVWRRKKVKT
jgi:LmbE family N-acetylglucosaminyl deacetylase